MPEIKTIKVKVYTIRELKEVNYRGYEKALETLLKWEYEDNASFVETVSENMEYYAKERGYEIDKGRNRGGSGNSLEWDSGRADYCVWSGSVYLEVVLPRYFIAEKIPPATRTMLLAMHKRGALSAYVSTHSGYMRSIMGLHVDYDEGDTSEDDPRTIARREAAVDKFSEWLHDDLNDTAGAMLKIVHDEEEYRSSEEYLVEGAEANEMVFTFSGSTDISVITDEDIEDAEEEDENA